MTESIRAQRTPSGQLFGACIALDADDLAFVESKTEWLTVEKRRTQNALFIRITGGDAL